jgi:hypothetical protein
VSVAAAEQAARARAAELRALIADIVPLAEAGALDLQAIYAANLVSGVVDAGAATEPPRSVERPLMEREMMGAGSISTPISAKASAPGKWAATPICCESSARPTSPAAFMPATRW